jgi:hypothetical protein
MGAALWGTEARTAPSHAGKLPRWEQFVFAVLFTLMGAFVVGVTITAAHTGVPSAGRSVLSAASHLQVIGSGQSGPNGGQPGTAGGGRLAVRVAVRAAPGRRLARALQPLVRGGTGHLAVGVLDLSTGTRAVYAGSHQFRAGGVVATDLVAALLLHHQRTASPLSSRQAALAAGLIEDSTTAAASRLYSAAGGPLGVTSANTRLGLTSTAAGPTLSPDLTTTTVEDQVRLLAVLGRNNSPLQAASRVYELGLMENTQAGERWGVSSAASAGTNYAIKDGVLRIRGRWLTNSIGLVQYGGHRLLIAVLADGQPSKAAGIALDSAAAVAAAQVITRI